MALAHSTKIATDGLVFAYDMGNTQKSWKGAPTTNLISSPRNLANDRVAPTSCGSSFTDFTTGGPTDGPFVRVTRVTTSPPVDWPWDITYPSIAIGTSFKFSCYARSINGSVSTIEFSNPDAEEASFALTPRWQRFSTTFTSGVQSNLQFMRINRSNLNDKVIGSIYDVADAQIEVQSVLTPFVNGTRANTQAIIDLMGNNTITAGSLTYAADNTFSFNGSTNFITIPNVNLGNGNIPWTVSAWVKTTTTVNALGGGSILSNSSGGPVYSSMGINAGKIVYWTYQNADWAQKLGIGKTVNDNNWHMLTWVNYNNYTMDMYVDGILDSNVPNSTSGNNNPVDMIGSSWAAKFAGSISSLHRYTRGLTAAEVQQNFNALRGRYGV